MLALSPVIGALAAGDAVVVKPSELAPATSALLAELLPRHLDARAVAVVEGGAAETTELLEQRFDTIFYTGNGRVGRIVMAAAAKHLTPVTLELGGKSPVYVDESADLDVAARRIAWAKFLNAGQTCVAPDYVLATPSVAERLVPRLGDAIHGLYGDDPLQSADLGRIVDDRHFARLSALLHGRPGRRRRRHRPGPPAHRAHGADRHPRRRARHAGGDLRPDPAGDRGAGRARRDRAGERGRQAPRALRVHRAAARHAALWTTSTSSGAIGFGIPAMHLSVPGIPFGGVGESGTGSYHGRRSVVAFSHEKAIFAKPGRPETLGLIRPPYTAARERIIRRLVR